MIAAPPPEVHSLWELAAVVLGSNGVLAVAVKKLLNGTPKRVEAMHKQMSGLATKDDVAKIERKVDDLQDDVTNLRERTARLEGVRK